MVIRVSCNLNIHFEHTRHKEMEITKETKKTGEHNKNENETEMSEADSKKRDIAVKVI